jgi:hypothetical protein
MTFEAINHRTRERTTFALVGSHTSTVRLGEVPAKWPACCGCQLTNPKERGVNPR